MATPTEITENGHTANCSICGRTFDEDELKLGALVREPVAELIREEHPSWDDDSLICSDCLEGYRAKHITQILEGEKGKLSNLEREVLESLKHHELVSENIDEEIDTHWTFGERLADRIASFGGSWTFISVFGLFLFVWIMLNSLVLIRRPFDPYPYILLNLILSCIAAIQAPVIMMSQNRKDAKDRRRSEHDYQVNLKAELEIQLLHEKLNHLLSNQWESMAQIQEMQLDQLSELRKRLDRGSEKLAIAGTSTSGGTDSTPIPSP